MIVNPRNAWFFLLALGCGSGDSKGQNGGHGSGFVCDNGTFYLDGDEFTSCYQCPNQGTCSFSLDSFDKPMSAFCNGRTAICTYDQGGNSGGRSGSGTMSCVVGVNCMTAPAVGGTGGSTAGGLSSAWPPPMAGSPVIDSTTTEPTLCPQGISCGPACCARDQVCAEPVGGLCCFVGESACGPSCCAAGTICVDAATGRCADDCKNPRLTVDDSLPPSWVCDAKLGLSGFTRDTSTSLVWMREPHMQEGGLTWEEARDFCAGRGARLPTKAEALDIAAVGDTCVFPCGWFIWTSTAQGNEKVVCDQAGVFLLRSPSLAGPGALCVQGG